MLLCRRLYRSSFAVVCVVVVGSLIGCYPSVNEYNARVTGTVTVGGELATGGLVTFHPVAEGSAAFGHIHKDGSYSLRTGQGAMNKADGGTVASGEYVATVTVSLPATDEAPETAASEPDGDDVNDGTGTRVGAGGPPLSRPQISAAKYRSKETSPLRCSVKPGDNIFVLELDRVAADGAALDDTNEEIETAVEETGTEEADTTDESAEETTGEVEKTVEETVEEATEEPSEPSEEAANTPAAEGTP